MIDILLLDAEFADNEELLELSIYNLNREEIYHSYYKPERIDDWRTDIHHITPEMVKDEMSFAERLNDVQSIINGAGVLSGFAVDNDLRVLGHSGVTGLDGKTVLDVRDMYWLMKGKETEMSPFAVPSLIACANSLGLDFDENTAHSASVDTEFTVKCFSHLFEMYKKSNPDMADEPALVAKLVSDIEDGKSKYIEEWARGYVRVQKTGDIYKVKYSHSKEDDYRCVVLEIEVADRYKAEYDLRKMLKKKEVPNKYNSYKLTQKQLDDIKRYSNTYDADESAWCKKIIRNLSRLTLG